VKIRYVGKSGYTAQLLILLWYNQKTMTETGEGMLSKPITENYLFYGDNLKILQAHIPSRGIDLIYLDLLFQSSRNYSVLFKDEHSA